ncbi:hypothetical protein CAPTEDRAFT_222840 [Capitella teleta]|uniref:Apple domain-containing protein n=1 Tax=Capitella teleta TaxID=283909 RepID=R7T7U1_CAPTE|nr:hypothetical protein CAPTEDRAFT_222840 [Capitella teleta]|eukprot:ELT87064.1 hypothetical protein CAPTEDRAFT_222840 [Capitella teleta]
MRTTLTIVVVLVSLIADTLAEETVVLNNCRWTKYPGMHLRGAFDQSYVVDLLECVKTCRSSPQCQGFDYDYNTDSPTCWLHVTSDGTGLSAMEKADHYVLDTCDAVVDGCNAATFTTADNTGPKDNNAGTQELIPGTTSIDDCQQQCIRIPECQAFSFYVGSSNACFIYKDDTYKTETDSKTGYTLKTLITRCPTAACPDNTIPPYFTTYPNQASSPGTASASRTRDECHADCIYDPNCVAVDIFLSATASDTYCWLQLDQANLENRTRQAFGSEQLMEQDIMTRCPSADPVTPTCYPPTYSIKRNYHSTPALNFNKITTAEACYAQCAATEYCVGVDIDTDPGATLCWMYNSLDFFNNNGAFKAGTLHAKLLDRCPSEPAPNATDCLTPTWHVVLTGTGHYPGYALPNANTLDACMNECVLDTSCVAIDVDNSGPENNQPFCYLLYSIDNEYSNPNVEFYKLDNRCPTTVVDCGTPIFEEFANTRSFSGEFQPPTTVDECKKACAESFRADPTTCVKIDFDSENRCYFHKTDSEKQSIPGINQYLLKDACPDGDATTETTPTTTTTTEPTTVTTAESTTAGTDCGTPVYTKNANTRSFGGVEQTGVTTLDECKALCAEAARADAASCVKFDFDARPTNENSPCYFHTAANSETQEITGIDQYVLDDACPAAATTTVESTTTDASITTGSGDCGTPVYTKNANTRSFSGAEQTSVTTLDECKALCAEAARADAASCVKFDFDARPTNENSPCYFHTAANIETQEIAGIDQYVLDDACPAAATTTTTPASTTVEPTTTDASITTGSGDCGAPVYELNANSRSFYGEQQTTVTTLDECKALCAEKARADATSCVKFDFDVTKDNPCFIHNTNGVIQSFNGIDQYLLIDACPAAATTTPSSTTTTTTSATTTSSGVTVPGCTTNFPTQWAIYTGKSSSGGTDKGLVPTQLDCRNLCLTITDTTCYAVDMVEENSQIRCYIFETALPATGPERTTPGIIHASIIDKCPTRCVGDIYKNIKVSDGGGTNAGTFSDSDGCYDKCIGDSTCSAAEYYPSNQECWTYSKTNIGFAASDGDLIYQARCLPEV